MAAAAVVLIVHLAVLLILYMLAKGWIKRGGVDFSGGGFQCMHRQTLIIVLQFLLMGYLYRRKFE